jgi:hypothetical protein
VILEVSQNIVNALGGYEQGGQSRLFRAPCRY